MLAGNLAPNAAQNPCIKYSFDYNTSMYTVKETPEFQDWLDGIRDLKTRIRLAKQLVKVHSGNLGDVEPVGDGISEMREHFGRRLANVLRQAGKGHYSDLRWWR